MLEVPARLLPDTLRYETWTNAAPKDAEVSKSNSHSTTQVHYKSHASKCRDCEQIEGKRRNGPARFLSLGNRRVRAKLLVSCMSVGMLRKGKQRGMG